MHSLTDILVVAICAVIGGCDSFDEIELFGKAHRNWFRKFIDLPNGIPSHDTFERVFARINPQEFRACFTSWVKDLAGIFTDVIAIDGQTHRGARNKGQKKSPVHMVSAWATGLRLVLAQTKVDEKSNEISAIPQVLKVLDVRGCIVTLDAMGCQQKIAQQIIEQEGDYILGLKGNQGNTLEAIEEHFSTISEVNCEIFSDVDKGHGRIETRTYLAVASNVILDLKEWVGLQSAIKVISTREKDGILSKEERFYLCSMAPEEIKKIGFAIRAHWGVENSLHYVLDVTFKQDSSRIRTENAPENVGVLRHIAMNILRQAPHAKKNTPSVNLKRKRAAMDPDYLEQIMVGAGLAKQ